MINYNNKKIIYLLIFILNICCAKINVNKTNNKLEDKVVATFSNGEVTLSQINKELTKIINKEEKLKNITLEKLTTEQKQLLIKEVIINNLAMIEAKKQNLDQDQDYQEALKLFESELLKQKLYLKIANEIKKEENLKKNYQNLVAKLANKKDYQISYIAIKDSKEAKKEADAIYEKLNKDPKKFAEIAKKKSMDKETAKKGGDLGFVVEDALPNEIISSIKKLKKGQISKPILTSQGLIILKLVDERKAKISAFSEVKEALAQQLIKKALEDFNQKLIDNSKVKFVE